MEKIKPGVEELATILHNLQLFKTTDRQDMLKLGKLGKFVSFEEGEQIIEHHGTEQTAYLVLDGCAGIYRDNILMARYEIGQFFGEFSMMDGSTYSASAKAEEDCEFLSISREAFLNVANESNTFLPGVIQSLCKKLRRHL